MKKLIYKYCFWVLTGLVLSFSFTPLVQRIDAAELILFDSRICEICKRFEKEVGNNYSNETNLGSQTFPIRRIDIDNGKVDFDLRQPVRMTPTFVFVDEGKEITRFVGYPGRKYFFQLIDVAAEEYLKSKSD